MYFWNKNIIHLLYSRFSVKQVVNDTIIITFDGLDLWSISYLSMQLAAMFICRTINVPMQQHFKKQMYLV